MRPLPFISQASARRGGPGPNGPAHRARAACIGIGVQLARGPAGAWEGGSQGQSPQASAGVPGQGPPASRQLAPDADRPPAEMSVISPGLWRAPFRATSPWPPASLARRRALAGAVPGLHSRARQASLLGPRPVRCSYHNCRARPASIRCRACPPCAARGCGEGVRGAGQASPSRIGCRARQGLVAGCHWALSAVHGRRALSAMATNEAAGAAMCKSFTAEFFGPDDEQGIDKTCHCISCIQRIELGPLACSSRPLLLDGVRPELPCHA